ncbi:hypothetical protein FIBSPDRAFT_886226 [Athelia psychrophila]|uniref:Uncharacterized protein n=1 Tax=Athelia psychrophila TaxID=1759441 RepID=A0A166R8A1_9AGAM|nr:hypothetical protein FIBSPDRAFT_886226 [Fibularhizoctonia sp. CBS 109695]
MNQACSLSKCEKGRGNSRFAYGGWHVSSSSNPRWRSVYWWSRHGKAVKLYPSVARGGTNFVLVYNNVPLRHEAYGRTKLVSVPYPVTTSYETQWKKLNRRRSRDEDYDGDHVRVDVFLSSSHLPERVALGVLVQRALVVTGWAESKPATLLEDVEARTPMSERTVRRNKELVGEGNVNVTTDDAEGSVDGLVAGEVAGRVERESNVDSPSALVRRSSSWCGSYEGCSGRIVGRSATDTPPTAWPAPTSALHSATSSAPHVTADFTETTLGRTHLARVLGSPAQWQL